MQKTSELKYVKKKIYIYIFIQFFHPCRLVHLNEKNNICSHFKSLSTAKTMLLFIGAHLKHCYALQKFLHRPSRLYIRQHKQLSCLSLGPTSSLILKTSMSMYYSSHQPGVNRRITINC